MKINFKDKLKILTIASARVDNYTSTLEEYLINFFGKAKYLYSRTNIYGQIMHVVKDIANLLFFYHEDAVIENNVFTAQKEISVRHFAEISGYNVTRAISSTGIVRLELRPTFFATFGTPVYIRKYAQLKSSDNALVYLVDINEDQKIIDQSSINVYLPLIEGVVKQSTYTADGTKMFTVELNDNGTIESSKLRVLVNNIEYKRRDSILDLLYNEEAYVIKTGYLSQYQIIFGNTNNGKCLSKGDIITIEYISTVGEYGNFNENSYPTFNFVSGVFNSNGEAIDPQDHINIQKESGFLMGSNGDTIDSLRAVIGYSSRSNILIDARSFEAYLAKYSFLSKIQIWSPENNRRINNILVLPNLMQRLNVNEEYFTRSLNDFCISPEMRQNIITALTNTEMQYLTSEIVWINPNFIKYVSFVYLEPVEPFINNKEIYESVRDILINSFINVSFSRLSTSQNIAKSNVISQIQNVVGNTCRISVIFVSSINEEAKINRYYTTVVDNKITRVEVAFGSDPLLGLTERNDIQCISKEDVPILRGGFNMLSASGESIMINDPVNLYINENNDWRKI